MWRQCFWFKLVYSTDFRYYFKMLIYHELVSLLKTFHLNINQSSCCCREAMLAVWPDWAIFYTLGIFSKPGAIIILPISPTHSRQFLLRCQNLSFTRGILLGQLLWTFGNFLLVTLHAWLQLRVINYSDFTTFLQIILFLMVTKVAIF